MQKETLYKVERCIKESGRAITPTEISTATGCHFSSVNGAIEVLNKYGVISVITNGRTKLVTYKPQS